MAMKLDKEHSAEYLKENYKFPEAYRIEKQGVAPRVKVVLAFTAEMLLDSAEQALKKWGGECYIYMCGELLVGRIVIRNGEFMLY